MSDSLPALSCVQVIEVVSAGELVHIRTLFRAYADGLGIDLEFQGFEQELASLPGQYASPQGCLLMATLGSQPAGCVALRPLKERTCEMKRLYVCPEARGKGIGRMLACEIVARARTLRYTRMRLDTLPWMDAAIALYRTLGFYEIAPYRYNPVPGAVYMELGLQ